MSEEKLTVEAFLEEASDMKNKIKELEQKLLEFEALYTDIDHKRLGALEKKYELNKENIPKTIHKYYNKNKEKIAELRNQIQNNSIVDLNHYTELKELSERNRLRVDELKDFRHNMAVPRITNLEERLPDYPTMSGIEVWCPTCNTKTIHTWKYEDKILVAREDLVKHFSGDMTAKEFKEKYLKEEEDEDS